MTLKLIKDEGNNKPESNADDILQKLNEPQRKAVEKTDGPVLVIAGAGSGKTRVLTYKIAYLIRNGVAPWNILALTFTNKAASEMKDRIGKIVSPEQTRAIWAGTFHSIFARILRAEAEKLGYDSSFSIYDSDDSLSAIKNVMNTMGISLQQFPPQGMRHRISMAKNKMMSWQEYVDNADSPIEKQTGLVYQAYEERLRVSNAMDFDDLLINLITLFRKDKTVLQKYQERFKYILVDEYQDTNKAQYIAVKMLADKNRNVAVVGDDAQSIYRWRGADIRNILDFQKDYPDATVVPLEQNYRSTKTILAAADSVIKRNNGQIKKNLWTDNIDGDRIDVLAAVDDKDEAQRVVKMISQKIGKEDYSPKDIAILYRTNAQSQALENALRFEKVPYIIIGGISFYKRKEIKDTIAYLKVLTNPRDTEALLRIINEPPRGLGQTSLNHLQSYARKRNISFFEALRESDGNEKLQKRAINAAKNFVTFIEKFITRLRDGKLKELIFDYIEATGILDMYKEIGSSESLDRWNNIQQLLGDLSEYLRDNPEATLEDYLQQISLVSDIDDTNLGDDQIKMMTLHSAKGLEFPIVFITGLEHGLFPLSRVEMLREEEEEERRLFYVGITRAMEKLYLSHAGRRARFGEYRNSSPSLFLNEIDPRFLKKEDPNIVRNNFTNKDRFDSSPKRQFTGKFDSDRKPSKPKQGNFFDDIPQEESYSQVPEDNVTLNIGDTVMHHTFGKGKLLTVTGMGKNTKAVVDFDSVGKKVLMLKFAKLQKIV